jgi:hypothetical protein
MSHSFKQFVGLEEKKEDSFEAEFNAACEFCTLTRTQRLYGFAACFVLGWLITLGSCFTIARIGTNPGQFAIMYTLGNLIALASTCFLFGPWKQIKTMFKPVRAIATIIYLVAMALTLYVAIEVQKPLPVIVCMVIQLCAMIWYCASYIPFGRKMITTCLGSVVGV